MDNRYSTFLVGQHHGQFLIRNEWFRWILLFIVFSVALAIRAVGVTNIPLDYHPIKQYRSALTARALYYENATGIPAWENEVARSSLERIGFLGPPVVDNIAAQAYSLMGREVLWIPRLFSVIYWIIGGIFLYAIARKMVSDDAALLSAVIYLFLPFGVSSSQSFQPDPLMIMLLIISLYTITVHYTRPTRIRSFIMIVVSAAAILIKPVSLFIIFGAFFALQLHKKGWTRELFFNKDIYLFFLLAMIPSLLYYAPGILNTTALNQQAQKSFVPQLFLDFNFWDGWLKRVRLSVGFTIFIGGMLSVFLFPNGWQKNFLFGLWVGYFAMCFTFNYTISTHDYYHLPLFPIIALSLGSAAKILMQNLYEQTKNRMLALPAWGILFLSLFLSAGTHIQALRRLPDYQAKILLAEKVGEAVMHSTQTIFLSPDDGKPLMYYGKFAGVYWPYWYDIRDEKLWGVHEMNPKERLELLGSTVEPRYFIVTDFEELENQQDLKQFLEENFPILVKDSHFVVYQLFSEN